jgi:hypothetical protein
MHCFNCEWIYLRPSILPCETTLLIDILEYNFKSFKSLFLLKEPIITAKGRKEEERTLGIIKILGKENT